MLSLGACSDDTSDPVVVGGTPTSQLKGTLNVTPSEFILSEGESIDLSATIGTTSLGPNQLTWSVEPSDVATIDIYGNLTALKHGEATVTARYSSVRGTSLGTVWAIPSRVVPAEALNLAGIVGRATPDSIGVRAVSNDGIPVPGVDVDFQVLTGDGSISSERVTTGKDGVARVEWALGTSAGVQQLHAGAEALGSLVFQADAIPDYDSATVAIVAGDDQEGIVTSVLPQALEARVTDQFGNILPGFALNWTFTDGGAAVGHVGSTVMAMTDQGGLIDVTWQLGPEAGDQEASLVPPGAEASGSSWNSGPSASAGNGPQASPGKGKGGRGKSWKARARPSDPAGVLINPSGARTVVGGQKTLTADVVDSHGNPIQGFSFNWEMDAAGVVDWVSVADREAVVVGVQSGISSITAHAIGVTMSGTGTVSVETRMPTGLARRAGDWQTGRVGEALAAPVSVLVTDQVGLPVPDVEVVWEIVEAASTPQSHPGQPAEATTVTDGNGVAQTVWSLGTAAGVQKLQAVVTGLDPVEFNANATPGAVAEISINPPAVEIKTDESVQFQAAVYDAFGNEVVASSLTWTSSSPTVASHLGDGVFRGLREGLATATAVSGEAFGQAEITVIFEDRPSVTVTQVTPAEGPMDGGTHVTVSGTGFEDGASVAFDGTAALAVIFQSPTTLRVTTPPGPEGLVEVSVQNPGEGQAGILENGFTYTAPPPPSATPPPAVGTVTPSSGPAEGGTQVIIAGSGFQNGASVAFNGVPSPHTVFYSETSMMATAPAGQPGPADIVVRNQDAQADTLLEAFTYLGGGEPDPVQITVTNVEPADGFTSGGTPVVLTGSGFDQGVSVTFGGISAGPVTYHSETSISVATPAGPEGPADIVVTSEGKQDGTLSSGFTYIPDPVQTPQFSVESIAPATGPETGGFPVTITGEAFENGAIVVFEGIPAQNVVVSSSNSLTATAPAGFPGFANVEVSLPGGPAATVPGGFTYQPVVAASNSIDLQLTRFDGGSGTVLVSNGIPLRQGDLMPGDLDQVRVTVQGVEKSIYVQALKGKHPDGSLRSVLVQFQHSFSSGEQLPGTFEWGSEVSRTLPDFGGGTPQSLPVAAALPTDPDFLVRTGLTIHPLLTEADARAATNGTAWDGVIDLFENRSEDHWNAYGADWLYSTWVYDRAMNHYTYWLMSGDAKYWYRAAANALESRVQSPLNPHTGGVAARFYMPDGMGMHYLATGDTESLQRMIGGVYFLSVVGVATPENLVDFGGPGESFVYAEGRIRARVLLGTLWAGLLEDTSADWGSFADIIVNGMITGQDADGGFTYRLGNDFTPDHERRYGQVNFMEGMTMDAIAKYYILRNANPQAVDLVQGMVDFLDNSQWSESHKAWHYWSPSSAWDMGDSQVPLTNSDELNGLMTLGHYWADYHKGTSQNRNRADAAIAQTIGPSGADFGVNWGKKVLNQFFYSGFAQIYYRSR